MAKNPVAVLVLAAVLLLVDAVSSAKPCALSVRARAFLHLVSQRKGGVRTLGPNLWKAELGLDDAEVGVCEWEMKVEHIHHHHVTMFVCKERREDCRPLFEDLDAVKGVRTSSGCVYVPARVRESIQDK